MGNERKEEIVRLKFSSKMDKFEDINSSVGRAKLYVCYAGRNQLNVSISKEVIERYIDTIYNCPIVCNYNHETKEIGGHDMAYVRDGKTGKFVNLTTPVGVIPESAQWNWEEVEEADGTIHDYLVIDALLWKRQEEYETLKNGGMVDQSMEIAILEGENKGGVYVVERFEFEALCLLGRVDPCYESASLVVFSKDGGFKQRFELMMEDMRDVIRFSSMGIKNEDATENLGVVTEGGEDTLKTKEEILEQYMLSAEDLALDIEGLTEEELEGACKALVAAKEKEEDSDQQTEELPEGSVESELSCMAEGGSHEDSPKTTPTAGDVEESATSASEDGDVLPDDGVLRCSLSTQMWDTLREALSAVTTMIEWFGEVEETTRYWLCDYDPDALEVFCIDSEDWNDYKFSYVMDGDRAVIDFSTKKRQKLIYTDYEDGSGDGLQATEGENPVKAVFSLCQEKHTKDLNELNELRKFKCSTQEAQHAAGCEGLFTQFSDLSGVDAFDSLVKESMKFSLEELEEKCYALRGRAQSGKFSLRENVSQANQGVKQRVSRTDVLETEYGGLFEKHGVTVDE